MNQPPPLALTPRNVLGHPIASDGGVGVTQVTVHGLTPTINEYRCQQYQLTPTHVQQFHQQHQPVQYVSYSAPTTLTQQSAASAAMLVPPFTQPHVFSVQSQYQIASVPQSMTLPQPLLRPVALPMQSLQMPMTEPLPYRLIHSLPPPPVPVAAQWNLTQQSLPPFVTGSLPPSLLTQHQLQYWPSYSASVSGGSSSFAPMTPSCSPIRPSPSLTPSPTMPWMFPSPSISPSPYHVLTPLEHSQLSQSQSATRVATRQETYAYAPAPQPPPPSALLPQSSSVMLPSQPSLTMVASAPVPYQPLPGTHTLSSASSVVSSLSSPDTASSVARRLYDDTESISAAPSLPPAPSLSQSQSESSRVVHRVHIDRECPQCNTEFPHDMALFHHCVAAHQLWLCPSPHCRRYFHSSNDHSTHLLSHNPAHLPHICRACGRGFSKRSNRDSHADRHSALRPFTCPTCGKSFTQKSYLKVHSRTHTGERPYQCRYPACDRRFANSGDVPKHERIHRQERPYRCRHCGQSFNHVSNYHRHTNHGAQSCRSRQMAIYCSTGTDPSTSISSTLSIVSPSGSGSIAADNTEQKSALDNSEDKEETHEHS